MAGLATNTHEIAASAIVLLAVLDLATILALFRHISRDSAAYPWVLGSEFHYAEFGLPDDDA